MKLTYLRLVVPLIAILSTFAWSQGVPTGPTRVAVIDSGMFGDEKAGITKLVNIYKSLNTEFGPDQTDLNQMTTRYEALAKDVRAIQDKLNAKEGDQAAQQKLLDQKVDEAQQLELTIKRKGEDAKARFEKKEKQLTGPIFKEIGDALDAFAKKNNIDMLLDITKLDALMGLNRSIDVTAAFIKDFNAKGAAVPVK